jgi:hypothetical protein
MSLSDEKARAFALEALQDCCLLYFVARNDANGNPRRLWALYSPAGEILAAYPEGYIGTHAVPVAIREKTSTCSQFEITPAEYRRILRAGHDATAGAWRRAVDREAA